MIPDSIPAFVSEALAEEPGLEPALIDRLPELLAPADVPAGALGALLAEVEAPPLRYAPFFDRLSELWDLPEPELMAVFEKSRDKRAWRKPPLPGLELMRIRGGPRTEGAELYLARFAPGMRFPKHRHLGHEEVLILEGHYTEGTTGRVYRSGDVHFMEADGAHDLLIAKDEPCVAAAAHHGIEFSSVFMRVLAKLFKT